MQCTYCWAHGIIGSYWWAWGILGTYWAQGTLVFINLDENDDTNMESFHNELRISSLVSLIFIFIKLMAYSCLEMTHDLVAQCLLNSYYVPGTI